jgi:hypothetical protein
MLKCEGNARARRTSPNGQQTNQRPRGEAEIDFAKRRNAAHWQSEYRRRRRAGLIQITIEVLPPDLVAAGQRLGLFAGKAADRTELAQIVMDLVHAATKGK